MYQHKKMEENILKNLSRVGEYMVYSIWIQNQLADLIILNRNKNIIEDFINTKEIVPLILKEERYKFWEKDFKDIKKEFEEEFVDTLTKQARADLNTIYYLRNAIAHSSISLARSYLLYKPKNEKILQSFKESLTIKNEDASDLNMPTIIKIDFSNDEIYFHNFSAIKRMDEIFLKNLCEKISIPHERIR